MRRWIVACLLVLPGCAANTERPAAPEVITPLMLEPPPIYALLGYRQDLGLSSQQITQLDSIAEATRTANAPVAEELRTRARERAGRNRSGMLLVDSTTGPALERIRENNRRAVAAVAEVLTEEQRATTCRLFGDRRRETSGSRPGAERRERTRRTPSRTRGGEAPDSVSGMRGARVWTWCAPERPAVGEQGIGNRE